MAKTILSVGFKVPGGECEYVNPSSNRSLLDADIIIFQPGITSYFHSYDSYCGKPSLSGNASFRARESLAHWKREIADAVNAGKVVVLLLGAPEIVYAATGETKHSGTGRNRHTTRIVEPLHAYRAIPIELQYQAATGTEMMLVSESRFFAPYWSEFGRYSRYQLYLNGDFKEPLLKTKTGGRIVGTCVRKGRGALLAVPALDLENQPFVEDNGVDGEVQACWTEEARIFGRKFTSAIVALADAIASESAVTPAPEWTHDDVYRLAEEATLEITIRKLTEQILQIDEKRRGMEANLATAGDLRRLLFEQGKPLEQAVLQALRLLGFEATGFKQDGSEFDAVFRSDEGRFIGEAEGKDNKAINIDKFSQLERNLNEDFAREDITEYAKGVLFGNAYRLRPTAERDLPFTEKCRTAAARLGVALIHTPDLFVPSRYLREHQDDSYAKACRKAIFAARGVVVQFPSPPTTADESHTIEKVEHTVEKTKLAEP